MVLQHICHMLIANILLLVFQKILPSCGVFLFVASTFGPTQLNIHFRGFSITEINTIQFFRDFTRS